MGLKSLYRSKVTGLKIAHRRSLKTWMLIGAQNFDERQQTIETQWGLPVLIYFKDSSYAIHTSGYNNW